MIYKLNDEFYNVLIIRKNIKNIYLRINKQNEIVITCNKNVSEEFIYKFIKDKSKWIEKNIKKIKNRIDYLNIDFNEHYMYFLGDKIYLEYIEKKEKYVDFVKDKIIVYSKNIKQAYKTLDLFIIDILKEFIKNDRNIFFF